MNLADPLTPDTLRALAAELRERQGLLADRREREIVRDLEDCAGAWAACESGLRFWVEAEISCRCGVGVRRSAGSR